MFQAKPPRSGLAADTAIESAFAAADGAAASALRLLWKCTCRGTDKAQLKLTMPGTSLPVFKHSSHQPGPATYPPTSTALAVNVVASPGWKIIPISSSSEEQSQTAFKEDRSTSPHSLLQSGPCLGQTRKSAPKALNSSWCFEVVAMIKVPNDKGGCSRASAKDLVSRLRSFDCSAAAMWSLNLRAASGFATSPSWRTFCCCFAAYLVNLLAKLSCSAVALLRACFTTVSCKSLNSA